MRATLARIARRAGVSVSTVSRVLNGKAVVNRQTKLRVLAAIKKSGYQGEKDSPARLLGFLMPVEAQHWGQRTPMLLDGMQAMSDVARAAGYACILGAYSPSLDQTTEDGLLAARDFAGVLVFRTRNEHADTEPFRRLGIPFVVVNRLLPETKLNYIGVDHREAAATATCQLIQGGCRQPALLVGDTRYGSHRLYVEAFRAAANGGGLVREIDLTAEHAYSGTVDLLKLRARPDALIVTGDLPVHGCLQALREARVRVPQDMAIINLDGTKEAAWAHPPLTSVEIPWYDMLSLGTRLLVDLIERQPALEQIGVCFKSKLVVRKSTRPGLATTA